jgi:hypothetical protein
MNCLKVEQSLTPARFDPAGHAKLPPDFDF